MWFDRVMSWAGGDDPETRGSKVRAFVLIIAIHNLAELWRVVMMGREAALGANHPSPWWFWPGMILPVAAAVLTFIPNTMRAGLVFWTCLVGIMHIHFFPHAGNHNFLMFVILALGAFLNLKEDREQDLFLQSVKWIVILLFFYSGVQKLIHGYYFRATQFAYHVSLRDNYQFFFKWLMSTAEFERLTALKGAVGDGPYIIRAPMVLLISNLVYLSEMAMPVLLLIKRWRMAGIFLVMLTLILIQSAARELFFFGLFMNGLLLFFDRDANRRALPLFVVYYGWLTLTTFQILPRFWFG